MIFFFVFVIFVKYSVKLPAIRQTRPGAGAIFEETATPAG
jgi:hypothetical protein